ncbi:MAG: alpha/beta hydrolase [Chloroflexi bacterium]|nr:alpha/beta hydrolase [Chloroflexota bacterium]
MVQTRRGARVRVLDAGSRAAPPLVFLHGLAGLLDDDTFVNLLAERYHVIAPELPGYGGSEGETLLEDMLDFALHGWDVIDELQLERPTLVGHSLGGMIAAEMACLAPAAIHKLVLVNPFGIWMNERPIPDLFALLPFEFGEYLFYQPDRAAALLRGATDSADPDALRQFFIDNARRLGTAGKILFPIPNRRLSKRLYRLGAETLVVWAEHDRLLSTEYAAAWQQLLPHGSTTIIPGAGHMLPYEQPRALAASVLAFLESPPRSNGSV